MTKHSPGPWHTGGKDGSIVYDGKGWAVCDVKTFHGYHEAGTMKSNARLIAAAPELLAALRDMVRFVGTDAGRVLSMIPEDTWYAAHHAIAKATD